MSRSRLADTKRHESRRRPDVQYIARISKSLRSGRWESFEAGKRFLDRSVQADGVYVQILREFCYGWGDGRFGFSEVDCCGWSED